MYFALLQLRITFSAGTMSHGYYFPLQFYPPNIPKKHVGLKNHEQSEMAGRGLEPLPQLVIFLLLQRVSVIKVSFKRIL